MSTDSVVARVAGVRQRTRRMLIVGLFAGYPLLLVGYSTLVATGRLSVAIWAPIAIALMALTFFGLATVYVYARDRASLGSDDLDEWQRAMRSRAYVASYGVLATVIVIVAAVLAVVLSFMGPVTLTMTDVAPWLIAVGVYLPALPSAVLAWLEPDALDDAA